MQCVTVTIPAHWQMFQNVILTTFFSVYYYILYFSIVSIHLLPSLQLFFSPLNRHCWWHWQDYKAATNWGLANWFVTSSWRAPPTGCPIKAHTGWFGARIRSTIAVTSRATEKPLLVRRTKSSEDCSNATRIKNNLYFTL